MDDCSNNPPEGRPLEPAGQADDAQPRPHRPPVVTLPGVTPLPLVAREDTISLGKWFTGYGLFLCLAWGTLIYLILQQPWPPTWTYTRDGDALSVNMYIHSTATVDNVAGTRVQLVQASAYPRGGKVSITVTPSTDKAFAIRLRLPQRSVSGVSDQSPKAQGIVSLAVNGEPVTAPADGENDYVSISRTWKAGDRIEMVLAKRGGWRAWLRYWLGYLEQVFVHTDAGLKLLVMVMYLSLCCTFIPLPTGWMVASMATRQASIMEQLAPHLAAFLPAALLENSAFLSIGTALLMGLAGALGSMLANLNDYHIITLMLRMHKVAKVRNTRAYRKAAFWFAKTPFFILVIFNILTIPVDVIRWLATIYRYPRKNFAAANFTGRFIRYFIIAFVTFYWNLGWIAPVTLLALGATLGLYKVLPPLVRRMLNRPHPDEAEEAT